MAISCAFPKAEAIQAYVSRDPVDPSFEGTGIAEGVSLLEYAKQSLLRKILSFG